jgi:hypothetical protein
MSKTCCSMGAPAWALSSGLGSSSGVARNGCETKAPATREGSSAKRTASRCCSTHQGGRPGHVAFWFRPLKKGLPSSSPSRATPDQFVGAPVLVDRGTASLGVEGSRPVPNKAQVELGFQVPVEVIGRDEVLQRDGDRLVEATGLGGPSMGGSEAGVGLGTTRSPLRVMPEPGFRVRTRPYSGNPFQYSSAITAACGRAPARSLSATCRTDSRFR